MAGAGDRTGRTGPRWTVEHKLGSVFRELEMRAVEDTRRAQEWACKQEEYRRMREEQERRARLVRIDRARVARLAEEVAAWRLACDARTYLIQPDKSYWRNQNKEPGRWPSPPN
jgi:hypothetical protein